MAGFPLMERAEKWIALTARIYKLALRQMTVSDNLQPHSTKERSAGPLRFPVTFHVHKDS